MFQLAQAYSVLCFWYFVVNMNIILSVHAIAAYSRPILYKLRLICTYNNAGCRCSVAVTR